MVHGGIQRVVFDLSNATDWPLEAPGQWMKATCEE